MMVWHAVRTNQLYYDGRDAAQPRIEIVVDEDDELVRCAPYAYDQGGHDEHVQEHVDDGQP